MPTGHWIRYNVIIWKEEVRTGMWKLPAGVEFVLGRLHEAGYQAYVVGGCVRDTLLGLPPKDWDVCTNALPEQM